MDWNDIWNTHQDQTDSSLPDGMSITHKEWEDLDPQQQNDFKTFYRTLHVFERRN